MEPLALLVGVSRGGLEPLTLRAAAVCCSASGYKWQCRTLQVDRTEENRREQKRTEENRREQKRTEENRREQK